MKSIEYSPNTHNINHGHSNNNNKKKKTFSAKCRTKSVTNFKGVNKLCKVASYDQHGCDLNADVASVNSNGSFHNTLSRVRSMDSINRRRAISSLSMNALCKSRSGSSFIPNKHMSLSVTNIAGINGENLNTIQSNGVTGIKPSHPSKQLVEKTSSSPQNNNSNSSEDFYVAESSTDEEVEHFTNDEVSSIEEVDETESPEQQDIKMEQQEQKKATERKCQIVESKDTYTLTLKDHGATEVTAEILDDEEDEEEDEEKEEEEEEEEDVQNSESEGKTALSSSISSSPSLTSSPQIMDKISEDSLKVPRINQPNTENDSLEKQKRTSETTLYKPHLQEPQERYTSMHELDPTSASCNNITVSEDITPVSKPKMVHLDPLQALQSNNKNENKNALSYVVPSSFRRNSRISADEIGNDRVSQGSQISGGMTLNAAYTSDNVNNMGSPAQTSASVNTSYTSNNGNNIQQGNANNNSSINLYHSNTKDDKISNIGSLEAPGLSENGNSLRRENNLEPRGHSNHIGSMISNGNRNTNASQEQDRRYVNFSERPMMSDMNALPNKNSVQQDDSNKNMASSQTSKIGANTYSSIGHSYMNDGNGGHQFNYINKDFLNSSDSLSTLDRPPTNDGSKPDFQKTYGSTNSRPQPLQSAQHHQQQQQQQQQQQPPQITSISELPQNDNASNAQPLQSVTSQKTDFSSSISSLVNHLQRPVAKNSFSYKERSHSSPLQSKNSQTSLLKIATGNNIGPNNKTVSYPKKSSLKTPASSIPNKNFRQSSKPENTKEESLNDFSSFLKSDSTDAESRTQQKLWLQRENSILDLSADMTNNQLGAVFMASSVEAKREFERISREYLSIKRYNNPLYKSVQRLKKDLSIEESPTPSKVKPSSSDLSKLFSATSDSHKANEANALSYLCSSSIESVLKDIWQKETLKFSESPSNNLLMNNNASNQRRNSLLLRNASGSQLFNNSSRSGSFFHNNPRSRGLGSYSSTGAGVIR